MLAESVICYQDINISLDGRIVVAVILCSNMGNDEILSVALVYTPADYIERKGFFSRDRVRYIFQEGIVAVGGDFNAYNGGMFDHSP